MNRRDLLQTASVLVLGSLVPGLALASQKAPEDTKKGNEPYDSYLKACRSTEAPKKNYLGHNEPYDKSLVHFHQEYLVVSSVYRAELFYESIPGKPPVMLTASHASDDRELMHHILELNVDFQKKNGPNTSGILYYDESNDQLVLRKSLGFTAQSES